MTAETTGKRRAVNLTLRADLLDEARQLGVGVSRAAEAGLAAAVRQARSDVWRRDNAAAIEGYNDQVDEGVFDAFLRRF